MKNIFERIYLFAASIIMALVGGFIAVNTPDYLEKMSAVQVQNSVDLFSDLRGMGGLLIVFGGYVLYCAARNLQGQFALLISFGVYATFALFRSFSIAVDGIPGSAILVAYSIEIVMAILGLTLLRRSQSVYSESQAG